MNSLQNGTANGILIVEDDRDIRDSLQELLEAEGYLIWSAQHGQEALEMLRSGKIQPNLILLDLMMPVMSGPEFLEVQKSEFSTIPVIVFTAATQQRPADSSVRAYLRKPLDLDQLLDMVSSIVPSR